MRSGEPVGAPEGRDPSSVLVTGSTGFVGSALVRAIVAKGGRAVALVRAGREGAAPRVGEVRSVASWSAGDLERALEGVTAVVHAAAVVHRPGAPREEYTKLNVDGTRALLDACRARGVRRFVYMSSIKVYGEHTTGVLDESTPVAPEGAYAETKLEGEDLALRAHAENGGPRAVVLRLCPVYGPGDKGNVRRMIRNIARRTFALPGDGATRKSIVNVATVTKVALAAIASDETGIFMVADRPAPSMRELADAIARVLGRMRPLSIPVKPIDLAVYAVESMARVFGSEPPISRELLRKSMTSTICSPEKAERAFGISCTVDLDKAIEEEVAWLRGERLI